ncbi:hypothetical protein AB6A40_002014 [Gnathostoma spinigerum]|uniref:Uncharacterized protein n=1 Tax=Gnathostoma spinigerum TaxID=75299 RepID=A0ABD6E5I9_9BILA
MNLSATYLDLASRCEASDASNPVVLSENTISKRVVTAKSLRKGTAQPSFEEVVTPIKVVMAEERDEDHFMGFGRDSPIEFKKIDIGLKRTSSPILENKVNPRKRHSKVLFRGSKSDERKGMISTDCVSFENTDNSANYQVFTKNSSSENGDGAVDECFLTPVHKHKDSSEDSTTPATPSILKKTPCTSDKKKHVHFDISHENVENVAECSTSPKSASKSPTVVSPKQCNVKKTLDRRSAISLFQSSEENTSTLKTDSVWDNIVSDDVVKSKSKNGDDSCVMESLTHSKISISPGLVLRLAPMDVTFLRNYLKANDMRTIGDLASVMVREVNALPIRCPKLEHLRKVLSAYTQFTDKSLAPASDELNEEVTVSDESRKEDVALPVKPPCIMESLRNSTARIPPTVVLRLAPTDAISLRNHLKVNGLNTVGDLAGLSKEQVDLLPIKYPKVETLQWALKLYACSVISS